MSAVTVQEPRPLHVLFLETVAERVTPGMVRDRAEQVTPILADLLTSEAAVGVAAGEGLIHPAALAVARALVIDPLPAREAPQVSPGDELRAAADAMDEEAAFRARNVGHISVAQEDSRDAAVLRATAELLRYSARCIDCAEDDRAPDATALAVARAFMGGQP